MSMTLYHGEPNGPSFTVLAALFEKGLTAELVALDLAVGERHGPKCPRNVEVDMSIEGEGPVLAVDGEAMADSVFIACYLDDIGSGTALRPKDPYARWQVMMWCRQMIERLAPAAAFIGTKATLAPALAVIGTAAFVVLTSRIASEDLKQRWQACRDGNFPDDQRVDSEAKVKQAAEKCELQLINRDWLMKDFSLADLETYAWLAGMPVLVPDAFANAKATLAWMERVRARPAVQKALACATVADPRNVWAIGPEINRWG
jgi:GSH-dependent disulfide-bond oxidoreductase